MKKAYKLVTSSAIALGVLIGATAFAVSCGRSASYSLGTYAYDYVSNPLRWPGKQDKELTIWLSYQKDQKQQKDDLTPQIEKILTVNNEYTVKYVDDSSVNYAGAANTLSTKLQAGEYATLPDVIINYPDIQAILEENGLAQDFDGEGVTGPKLATLITPAMQFDITSVFTNKPGAYALPLLKSTDLTAFDVPAFAMLLNDIAAQREDWEVLKVVPNSPQQRIVRMILANQTKSQFNISGVYEQNDTSSYGWSEIAAAWAKKTGPGAIWEKDKIELEKNFVLRSSGKTQLLGLDWTSDLFGSYDGLKTFSEKISAAYDFLGQATRVVAVDTASNMIYSYQYDLAGHNSDGFFIKPDNSNKSPRMIFDFSPDSSSGASIIKSADFVSDMINLKALGVKTGENDYSSSKFVNHNLFLALISSNAVAWSAPFPNESNLHQTNLGEVYFDLQPSKAASGEQKRSIINQGPSLMVTKAHPNESAKIAGLFKKALSDGVFSARYNTVTKEDEGLFSTLGYSYSDAKTNQAGSPYLSALNSKVASTSDWHKYVSKYLLTDYLSKAEENHWNTFNNPATSNTSLVRKWFNEKYSAYASAVFAPTGRQAVAEIVNYIVPDARLYRI